MHTINESELILNPDGSIYHLNVKPENLATNIILVGDQDRVEKVTQYFDTIDFRTQKREFKTQTGTYKGKRISVVSTGIGTDNIDIVLNELDALVNIDFQTRQVKNHLTTLNIIRVGTSGSLQDDIPVDALLMSSFAIGTDAMLHSYLSEKVTEIDLENQFISQTNWAQQSGRPYAVAADEKLIHQFDSVEIYKGITITSGGFYGAQGRELRLKPSHRLFEKKINGLLYKGMKMTNMEMETAGIYGLAKLLNHRALSLNAIVANRPNGTFSTNPQQTVSRLIEYSLEKLSDME